IVDAAGDEVADGEVGELVMRGPTLFSGYFRDPDATSQAFRSGWYHSGDMFVRNADGSLTYSGRAKYLIKSGGENIYPAEIERVILAITGVEDVVSSPGATRCGARCRWPSSPARILAWTWTPCATGARSAWRATSNPRPSTSSRQTSCHATTPAR
ncbi:MAG: long-chain fatty acid--CoA ligase, partial [Ramlibacter sp.]|nr:long-chain fatty acid--CoA ligase [Ramlibacter sp.]